MRTTFIRTLCELAEADERIWLLCGDLGYSVLEVFAERFPNRYVNVGVAEQNMTGIAAGLAHCGKTVFTYSIANFPVMRCLEQIRNDVCYHNLNVKVVAVGGGLAYGAQGYTHHGVEDLAVTRVLPNMTVVAPGDPVETRLATQAVARHQGPCYLRLGKANEPVVHEADPPFELGRAIPVRAGTDVALISTGGMLKAAMTTADLLAERGLSAQVLSMPTVQPLDTAALAELARLHRPIVTLEEHAEGGLASAIAEALVMVDVPFRLLPIRLGRSPISGAGSQAQMLAACGLAPDQIADRVSAWLNHDG